MTKIQKKALVKIQNEGWTFAGDNIFSSYAQARRCLLGLVRAGLVQRHEEASGAVFYTLPDEFPNA